MSILRITPSHSQQSPKSTENSTMSQPNHNITLTLDDWESPTDWESQWPYLCYGRYLPAPKACRAFQGSFKASSGKMSIKSRPEESPAVALGLSLVRLALHQRTHQCVALAKILSATLSRCVTLVLNCSKNEYQRYYYHWTSSAEVFPT
jgi:hypothetical protein